MNGMDFCVQLDRLREGKLILQPPGESGLTAYASSSLYELRSYVSALERGYRALTGRLEAYRGQARGKTLGEMISRQWSEGACLGYAAMAMIQKGLSPERVVDMLEIMEELMATFELEYAEEFHRSLKDGKAKRDESEEVPC